MSSAPIRQEFEDLIRRDLLGPAGGDKEVITESTVRDRYLLGILGPLKVTVRRWARRSDHWAA